MTPVDAAAVSAGCRTTIGMKQGKDNATEGQAAQPLCVAKFAMGHHICFGPGPLTASMDIHLWEGHVSGITAEGADQGRWPARLGWKSGSM